MLSIVHTAEVQFRHESTFRDRDFAILASIRERQDEEAVDRATRLAAKAAPIGPAKAGPTGAVANRGPVAQRRPRAAANWARPIYAQHIASRDPAPCPAGA